MLSKFGLLVMRLTAFLPLSLVRALGAVLGLLLYAFAWERRRVTRVNLQVCFPKKNAFELKELMKKTFIKFAQAWLDRSWLWHGPSDLIQSRLQIVGDLEQITGVDPVVIFAPHFVGLDAGWTALTQQVDRSFSTIYTQQANKTVDSWVLKGRQRFGKNTLISRYKGAKQALRALQSGDALYLLPDMDYGPVDSLFVSFYGIPTATVPSLSRFAKLAQAKVVPVVTRLTLEGYEIHVMPAWDPFPGETLNQDAWLMNQRLEALIQTMPEQYFWVHKRFKTRPKGDPSFYE